MRTVQAFGCLVATSIISLIFLNLIKSPSVESAIKLFMMPCFCIPLTVLFLHRERPIEFKEKLFKANKLKLYESCGFMLTAVLILMMVSVITAEIIGQTEAENPYADFNPIIVTVAACILGPVSEEILYRGILCESNSKFNTIFVSCLFAAVHFSAEDFPYLLILSLLSTYAYHKYESIYPSIIIHAVCNTIMIAAAYGVL